MNYAYYDCRVCCDNLLQRINDKINILFRSIIINPSTPNNNHNNHNNENI